MMDQWKKAVHFVLDWAKKILAETPAHVIPLLLVDLNDGVSIVNGTPGEEKCLGDYAHGWRSLAGTLLVNTMEALGLAALNTFFEMQPTM